MPFKVVRGVGPGMSILDGVEIVEGEGAVLRPIGTLWCSRVKLCESIEMPFGTVSGVR